MIEIDGSFGEGGGQVLRTALALSSITGQPTRIHNVRARRRNPGLAPQHLTNLLAVARIAQAQVAGASLGSTEIVFCPEAKVRSGEYAFDVADAAQRGSAGSVTLILQTLLLPLALAGGRSQLILMGGTHVPWSPPFDFIAHVYLPTLAKMGIQAATRLESWGFYPRGGGRLGLEIETRPGQILSPLMLRDRGMLRRVWGRAVAANLPETIPDRMVLRAHEVLSGIGTSVQITPTNVRSIGPGAGLFLIAEYEHAVAGFSALGERGKRSEEVAEEACRDLVRHHTPGSPVDEHLGDQLLLPMALATGRSEFRTSCVTRHLLTGAHVIRQFLPVQIEIEGSEGSPGTVVVLGPNGR